MTIPIRLTPSDNPFDTIGLELGHHDEENPFDSIGKPTMAPTDALGSIRSRVPHASAAPEVTARASVAATPAPEVTPTPAPIETAAPPTAPPSKPVAGVPYTKSGHSVIDTDNADANGHVPTHRLDQPTNRQPGESFPDYETRVLARTSWSPDTAAVSSLDALDPSVEPSVKQLMDAAAAAGHRITPDETRRTQERQEMLFQRGRTPGSGPKPATWTLTSDHTPGRAVDFSGDSSAYEWLQENAPKFGFSVMGDMDPGHVAMPEPADANAPGPFAEQNAAAFHQEPTKPASTKLERATTSGRDATVTPATAPAPSGMSAARALGINDAVDPTTGRAPLLARAANAVNEMVAHPGNTAAGFVTAPLEALWTAQKEATQQNERASFATAGLDPDSVRQMVQPRDAAAAAAQLGALALGPLADLGMSAAAKPLTGSIGNAFGETAADVAGRAAAVGIHGATGAGIGAAFSPTDPAVGALLGGATGAVPTAILGGRVTPNIREGTPNPANLADHPDRLLGRRTPPPRARAKIDFTPEAPSGSPFDVEMNTIDEALGRTPTPAAPQQMTAEELQQRRNAEEALAAKAQQSPPIDLSLPPRVGRDPFERPGLADMEIGPKNGKPAPPKLSIIEQLKRAAAPADELSKGVNPFDEIAEEPAEDVSHSAPSSDVAKQEAQTGETPNERAARFAKHPQSMQNLLGKTPQELQRIADDETQKDKNVVADVFGAEGATRYSAAQRTVNSSMGHLDQEKYDRANKTIADMEDALTDAQRDRLFGIADGGLAPDQLRDAARWANDYAPHNTYDMPEADLYSTIGRELTTGSPEKDLGSALRLKGAAEEIMRRTRQPMGEVLKRAIEERVNRGHATPSQGIELLQSKLGAMQKAGINLAGEPKQHDYSSTQVNFPQNLREAMIRHGSRIPEEDLADDGREYTPHITVKYGLHGNDVDALRKVLENEPPIRAKLGKSSLFQNDDADVVKLDVDSPDLHRINKKISEALPNTDTHPDYVPHATIAYVKPGRGKKYAGDRTFEGTTVEIPHVTFSDRNGNKIDIPLRGTRAAGLVGDGERDVISDNPFDKIEKANDAMAARSAKGVVGRKDVISLPGTGSGEIPHEYAVVDAKTLKPSHNPVTFQPNPGYPEGVQGRAYHGPRGAAARQNVEMATSRLNPTKLLDAGSGVSGPPVITPDGVVAIGNQRAMMLQRGDEAAPERMAEYRKQLRERAALYGIDPRKIDTVSNPVLVRRMTRASDYESVDRLRDINRISDTPGQKTKDTLSDASSRAKAMESAHDALDHFATTIGPDDTIRDYLGTAAGRTFVTKLVADGVIQQQELPKYVDVGTNTLTTNGKQLIEDMMMATAVGDADVAARAPAAVMRKLEHAIPMIVRASTVEGFDLRPALRSALDLMHAADAAGSTVPEFIAQPDLLGRTFSPEGQQLATYLEKAKKADISKAFRQYAEGAIASTRAGQSDDFFGHEPETPRELAERLFGPLPKSSEVHGFRDGSPSGRSRKPLITTKEFEVPKDLPAEFNMPEIRSARDRADALKRTSEIRTPAREAWRNEQAQALVDGATKFERRADLVLGLPGSGKTSTTVDPLVSEHGAALLDSDIVKRNAPEWNDGLGASALHVESGDVRNHALDMAMQRGANIVFPTVGDPVRTVALAKYLVDRGYEVHAHFIDLPPATAARRVLAGWENGERHFVDPAAILEKGDEPRRGFAALADTPGVIAHEPHSNDVPRGSAPRQIVDWRSRWGAPAGESGGVEQVSASGSLLRGSGRPGGTREDGGVSEGARPSARSTENQEVEKSPDRPAESGDRVSGNDVHEFSTSGSTPRAKARPIKPDGSVGSVADKTPLPDATGLEQERSSLRLREILPSLRALFHPEGLSAGAKGTAGTIRHENAVSFHDLAVANERLREFGRRFGKLKKADAVKYWDAAERGVDTGDAVFDHGAKLLQAVTKKFTDELIALDRLKADAAIANYIGRYWDTSANNGGKVTDFLRRVLGKRPFEGPKSWQKHRSFEFFKEGLDAGLTPATYNYVDSQLAKIAEMQRVIAAERMLRAEQTFGRAKRVMLGKEAPIDEDGNPWVRIGDGSDPAFTVYAPPTTTVHEAFDAGVRKGLEQAIERLDNLKHTRAVSVGRKKLGWAKVSGDEIASKFGSHDGVIMHELGHILDTRYPLRAKLAKVPATEDELKALADLRFEHSVHASKKFKAYVREPAEQMANALHALIHAPELMQKVAPNTKRIITDYLKSRRELAPILDIKPSLSLETGRAEQRLPGPVLAGFWYAPKASAAVWSNFLSRGWRGNPLYDALLAPAQASTQILLGLSGFHATTIATEGMFSDLALAVDHLANGGSKTEALKSVLRAPAAPFRMSVKGRKVMQEYRAPGTHPELARVLDAMIQGGYRGTAQLEYVNGDRLKKLKKAFADAVEGQSAGRRLWGATRLPLDALWAGVEIPTQFLMGRYVPWMKTAATYELTARELAKLPQTATMDDVHRVLGDVVKEMDLRFGQVTYENWFVHNAAKHLAQLVFLAPGWTFGTATLTGRGVRDVAQIAPRSAKAIGRAGRRFAGQDVPEGTPEPLIGKSAAYWIGAVLGTMLINAWLTRAHTGEDPHGKDFFAYRDGTKDADGNPNRHRIPGYLMHDVYGYGTHPVDLFKNKLSPTLAFLERAVANKDYFGDMLYDPQASPAVKAKQLGTAAAKELATPLSAQNFLEDKQRGEHGAGDMVRDAFGVTPAKREFVRTDAQNLMAELLARQGHTARTPTEVDSARGRADVFRDYREGTRSKGDIIQLERAGELTQGQGKSIIRRAREEGLVTKFKQLTADEAEKVFAIGTDEERQLWWPWMLRKRGAARRERAFRHGVSSDRP